VSPQKAAYMPATGLSKTTKRFSETYNMDWPRMRRLAG
jgi:hypothetical protein